MPYLKKPEKRKPKPSQKKLDRHKVYASSEWQKIRQAKLIANPLCEICLKASKLTPATQVHHIISPFDQKDQGYYAYNFNNLISICEHCHGEIHGKHLEATLHSIFYDRESSQEIDESKP